MKDNLGCKETYEGSDKWYSPNRRFVGYYCGYDGFIIHRVEPDGSTSSEVVIDRLNDDLDDMIFFLAWFDQSPEKFTGYVNHKYNF